MQLRCAQREVLNLRVCRGQCDTSVASSPSRPSRSREARWWASSSCWQRTFVASLNQIEGSSFISASQQASSTNPPNIDPIRSTHWSSTILSVRASWPRRTVEGLVEMWGERSTSRAHRLKIQPTSRGRLAPWGNSSTVTSFSNKKRRSHPLEAENTPSVTDPGQHRELISQMDFTTPCGLQRDWHLLAQCNKSCWQIKYWLWHTQHASGFMVPTYPHLCLSELFVSFFSVLLFWISICVSFLLIVSNQSVLFYVLCLLISLSV